MYKLKKSKMELIAHRINNIKELKKLPKKYGAEIDLRSYGSKIILNHDPQKNGDKFENYLSNYNHGTLILNIKRSGIKNEVLKISRNYNLKIFFYLMSKCLTSVRTIRLQIKIYH